MYLTEQELALVFENMRFALEQLTDDFTDPVFTDHYQKDITLLNKIHEAL